MQRPEGRSVKEWPKVASNRLVMSVTEAAELLGISRGLAYELARSEKLPVVRLGRRLVVPRKALALWLERSCGLEGSGALEHLAR